ncbi:hypothetical protein GA0061087_104026 [Priestia flexa]|nr:hypothetical protein GA0061087_104026 [Priestia flexa]
MDAILLQYNGLVNRYQEKLAKLESCKAALKEKEAQFQRAHFLMIDHRCQEILLLDKQKHKLM